MSFEVLETATTKELVQGDPGMSIVITRAQIVHGRGATVRLVSGRGMLCGTGERMLLEYAGGGGAGDLGIALPPGDSLCARNSAPAKSTVMVWWWYRRAEPTPSVNRP